MNTAFKIIMTAIYFWLFSMEGANKYPPQRK